MNILFVGFGGMGCRHAQSFLTSGEKHKLYVVEPSRELFDTNLVRIGGTADDLTWFDRLDSVNVQIDFAVVATPTEPRYEIVKKLLNSGVNKFLLEKVVFQSVDQFQEIISLLESKNASGYCNFVNRYFPQYKRIMKSVADSKSNVQMHVRGGDFGLACNGLHYIDLFEYITGASVANFTAEISESSLGNKRGKQYKEAFGTVITKSDKNNTLSISSLKEKKIGVEVTIVTADGVHIFDEDDLIYKNFNFNSEEPKIEKFEMIPSSRLTFTLYKDIMNGTCLLPTVQESFNAHEKFFKTLNPVLVGDSANSTICPIT